MKTSLCVFLWALVVSPLLHADQSSHKALSISENDAWWSVGYRESADAPEAKRLPLIRVEGNRFVGPEGKPLLLRGLSIADPDRLQAEGRWTKEMFQKVAEMGADVVRLPVHPAAWRRRGTDGYLALLDQAVKWCSELEMHVIIDWHSIGNLKTELFQHPMYETTRQETFEFWRTIARHFSGHNTVAFYELFNEPTMYRGQLGHITWTEWKRINEEIITVIRYWDKETIPLIAGFDWAYDLNHLRYEPLNVEGIGYVSHPYPNKRSRPWEPKWEENFAFAADHYPIFATELGFTLEEGEVIDDNHYGNRITRFLERRGISWMAWVFDPGWHPQMLQDWDFNLTASGQFFREALQRPAAPVDARLSPPENGPGQID